MECKITFTKARATSAYTIVEVTIASAVALVVALAITSFTVFSTRTFVAMGNYTDLNEAGRVAIDKMSKDIRGARSVTAASATNLTFTDVNSNSLQFVYDQSLGQLERISGGTTTILLTNCDSLKFATYQPIMISNSFLCYTDGVTNNIRVIQVNWSCYRDIYGKNSTTENDESAEIVMRNH